jgi:hypothetical protein
MAVSNSTETFTHIKTDNYVLFNFSLFKLLTYVTYFSIHFDGRVT